MSKTTIDVRCNCENLDCKHEPGACNEIAYNNGWRIQDLGRVCGACYETYPKKYRVAESRKHRY